jgi:hypothetical protein
MMPAPGATSPGCFFLRRQERGSSKVAVPFLIAGDKLALSSDADRLERRQAEKEDPRPTGVFHVSGVLAVRLIHAARWRTTAGHHTAGLGWDRGHVHRKDDAEQVAPLLDDLDLEAVR